MRIRTALVLVLLLAATVAGASTPAWLQRQTEHFTFIYREDRQYAVDELVTFAEEVYDEVTGFFESTPQHVPVVIFGETDQANGYYSPAPPQHIGLYLPQPTLPWLGARTESWLRTLFVHELTHYVQANYDRGLFYLVGTIFGRTLTGLSLGLTPLWHTEGLAVNTETIFTGGGRGRDPFFEMTWKAHVVEDRLYSLNQAGYDSHLAPRGRYYSAGYFIWDYLLEEYGRDYVVELSQSFARFPLFGVWGPIRRTSGTRMRELYAAIEADLIRRYADEAGQEPDPRVTPAARSDYYLPTQTERGLFVYRVRPDRTPGIVVFDVDTGREEPVLEMRMTDEASWSVTSDGGTIAFATYSVDGTYPDEQDIDSDLYLYETASGQITPLTEGGGYHQPAISPDGSFLVAVERHRGHHRLVRFDLAAGSDGGDETGAASSGGAGFSPRVLVAADRTRFYTPDVSPDGARVVVAANQQGRQQIMLVDADSGSSRLLPQPAGGAPYFPDFADSASLLYGSDATGSLELYRHRLDDDEIVRVADDPVGAFAGELVDDRLLVSVYTADGYAVRTTPARAGDPQPVASDRPTELAGIPSPPDAGGEPWTAWPKPAFWLPTFGLAGPGFDPSGIGAGPLVYGGDLLYRNSWQAAGIYYPALGQFDYLLGWTTTYGPLTVTASAESIYSVISAGPESLAYSKQFLHGGTLSYTILSRYRLGVTSRLAARVGATNSLLYASRSAFGAGDIASDTGPLLDTNRIVAGADLAASRSPLSSRRAFHAPGGLSGSLSAAVPFDAPSFSPGTLLTVFAGSANVGLGRTDHVITLAPTLTWSTNPLFASPVGLRGFGVETVHAASTGLRGRYGVSIDYRTPHLLVDLPLLPGVGITAFGFGLFAESTGGYEVAPAAFALDRVIGFGAEVTTVVTYWTPIPVTVGVAARVDASDPAAFSLRDDLTVYLNSSLIESIPRLPQYLSPQR